MLTLVQRFCRRTNLTVPSTVYGSTDPQIRQAMSLLEEEGNDLASRGDWEMLVKEATHTSIAAEDQGAITSIATNGFRHIKNNTIWNRSLSEPIYGGVSPQDWQALKGTNVTGPRYQFRIRGGKLLVNPAATADETWAFEYVSSNWILGADGTTYKQYFTLDTDTLLLPEELLLMGLRWRWKKEKGLEYSEDFRTYETQVRDALARDGAKRALSMGGDDEGARPRVFIPAGTWITP